MTVFYESSSRVVRLLRLISLLQNGERCTVVSLQESLGISRRTLFRDLRALENAGCFIQYQRKTGYRMNRGPTIPLEALTAKELLGMLMLGKLARRHTDQPMVNHGLAALYRTISAAPADIRDACTDLMSHISVPQHTGVVSNSLQQHFLMLVRMINEKSVCCIEVGSQDDMDSICLVPQTLVLKDQGWEVAGESVIDNSRIEVGLADIASIEEKSY